MRCARLLSVLEFDFINQLGKWKSCTMWAYHKQFWVLPSVVILIFNCHETYWFCLLSENFTVIIPTTLTRNQLEPTVFKVSINSLELYITDKLGLLYFIQVKNSSSAEVHFPTGDSTKKSILQNNYTSASPDWKQNKPITILLLC